MLRIECNRIRPKRYESSDVDQTALIELLPQSVEQAGQATGYVEA